MQDRTYRQFRELMSSLLPHQRQELLSELLALRGCEHPLTYRADNGAIRYDYCGVVERMARLAELEGSAREPFELPNFGEKRGWNNSRGPVPGRRAGTQPGSL